LRKAQQLQVLLQVLQQVLKQVMKRHQPHLARRASSCVASTILLKVPKRLARVQTRLVEMREAS
jgi:hypothetical protein